MRIKSCPTILSLLLLTSALRIFAQPPVPATDSVSVLFTKFIQSNTDKSNVVLTDRNVYIAGEKIWFKAYSVNENNGKPDLTFNNLFADLVNDKDSVVQQLVLDNTRLYTDGAFSLPESAPTGFYWIRCYTAKQLESGGSGILLRPVYIVNKQLDDEKLYAKQFRNNLANNNKLDPSIHFFAERLTALPGFISTGVVEIRDGYNNPLLVSAELVNSKDSVITNFKTNSLGLARLTFVNDPAEKYTIIFHPNGHVTRYQLPAVDEASIQLSVGNQTTKTIKAFVTLEDSVSADTHTTLLAVQRDHLYYAAVGKGNYGITIPIDNFPGGVVRLLLFEENKSLVSERKIYIPKENVELQIKPDKKKYAERENVDVHIKLRGPSGKPLASVLNVAVQNEGIEEFSDSIEAKKLPPPGDFLLDNWLNRHHIKYSTDDIDLFMVTRKSSFQRSPGIGLNKEARDYDDNKKLLNLSGEIINKKGYSINDRIITEIATNSSGFFMDVDTTDKDGIFSFLIPQRFDSLQLSLQVTTKHQLPTSADSIKIDGFHFPGFRTPLSLKQQFLTYNNNTVALLQKYYADTIMAFQGKGWLKPVTVKAIKKDELNYDVSRRITSISKIVTSDKFRYGGPEALVNALLMVPGVSMLFSRITIFGPTVDLNGVITEPLVIMDGFEMPTESVVGLLNTLNPADIDFIEVLRGGEAAIYGGRAAGGVISINSKHGPDKIDNNNNLRAFTPVTYHVCPKFEMPDYSNKEIKSSSSPDSRTTIYWNGNIITDANGEAKIHFYTADNATNYVITITGLTENGDLVYKRIIIDNTKKGR